MKTAIKTKTPAMLAFHKDKAVKAKYLARIQAHRKADELRSGFYWEERGEGRFMGCAVGCILHSSNHANAEREIGVPSALARLLDRLFESLWRSDQEFAKGLPERFIKAPKVGADLTLVWAKFAHWMLLDLEAGVIRFAKTERTKAAIQNVGALYQRWIAGDKPATAEWESVRSAAADAAYAYAAAAADDAYAYAYAAAAAAAYAYAAAAAAYAYAAAADAYARSKHYKLMANKLISLMEEAK